MSEATWESVTNCTNRLRVDGGWIYRDVWGFTPQGEPDRFAVALAFVPDHEPARAAVLHEVTAERDAALLRVSRLEEALRGVATDRGPYDGLCWRRCRVNARRPDCQRARAALQGSPEAPADARIMREALEEIAENDRLSGDSREMRRQARVALERIGGATDDRTPGAPAGPPLGGAP